MDHTDNLDQLEQEVMNLDTDTSGLENRTNDIEQDVLNLTDSLVATDMRILDLEDIHLGTIILRKLISEKKTHLTFFAPLYWNVYL